MRAASLSLALLLCWISLASAWPSCRSATTRSCPLGHRSRTDANAQRHRDTEDPLVTLNLQLGNNYALNEVGMLNASALSGSPVVTTDGNTLSLYLGSYDSPVATSEVVDGLLTQFKLVSHLALASFVMVQPSYALTPADVDIVQLSQQARDQVQSYVDLMIQPQVRASLSDPSRGFSSDQLARQQRLFDACSSFLLSLASQGSFARTDLASLVRTVRPDLDANIADSARDTLVRTHGVMMDWKAHALTAEEWNKLRVVVLGGSHMPRQQQMFMQYFSRLLDSPIQSDLRVMYAEADEVLDGGFGLLATHLMDFSVGQVFFDDPLHMHQDILAPATTVFLDELLPGYPDPNAVAPRAPMSDASSGVPIAWTVAIAFVCILSGCALGMCMQRRRTAGEISLLAAEQPYTSLSHPSTSHKQLQS